MVDFASVPHIFQSWSTDPSTQPPGSSDGSMQQQHSGYHQSQLEGSPQSRYHHPVVGSGSPQQPVDDSHSVGSSPQFGYERRFPHFSKENNHAESSSSHGWNDGKNVQLANNDYPACGTASSTTSDYSYTKYDYGHGDAAGAIGSSAQGQITSDNSFVYQQQSYYFYNGIPMSGPTPALHSSAISSMPYGQDRPSTTLVSDQYTTEESEKHSTPISSLSAPTIASGMASASISPPPENLRTASPLIQCTFAYYEPPKPSERKSPAKKKKPAMACLFCRVRKIACAPPVPGGLETRCNQCARRDITCEYPKESRRGQYRRMQYLERVGKEVAEKIAEVERQSAMIAAGDRKKGVRKLSAACQPY